MKTLAITCNIILFAFTCLVLATDGLPVKVSYMVFTVWLLLTLALTPVVIFRSSHSAVRIVALICNTVVIGFVIWAFIDQYPHPKEEGYIAYLVLTVLTPILNLAALLLIGAAREEEEII
jgi:multidrug transporter EmrE-like cation transporter